MDTAFQLKTRHFKYQFIPAKRKSKKMMIVLHGRGDSLKPFKNFDQELGISELNYLLLNAPRKYLKGFSWYGEPPFEKTGVLRIRSKLFDLIHELEKKGYKTENIFLFGFSQGCLVSADVALNYPKKFGGVLGISGYFHFFPRWRQSLTVDSKKTPWIMTHGYKDDILPYQDTKFGAEKLKDAGLDIEFISLNKKHDMIDEELPILKRWVKEHL
ncbi:MAG: serine esterase [Bdellovibrionaceae bacterium]|nr:serine esterase [Pseudobdellovibrionaceae bacterium]